MLIMGEAGKQTSSSQTLLCPIPCREDALQHGPHCGSMSCLTFTCPGPSPAHLGLLGMVDTGMSVDVHSCRGPALASSTGALHHLSPVTGH